MAHWRAQAESTFIPTVILRALLQNISTSQGAEVQRHKAQWKHTDGFLCCFPGAADLKVLLPHLRKVPVHSFLNFLAEHSAVDATRSSSRAGRKCVQEPSHRLQYYFLLSAEMDTTDLTACWFPWRLFRSLLSQSTFYHFAASTEVPSATFGFYWTFKTSLRKTETLLKSLAVRFYTFTHRLELALLNVFSVSSKFLHKQNQALLLCQDFPWMPCSGSGGVSGFNLVVLSLAGTLGACQSRQRKVSCSRNCCA